MAVQITLTGCSSDDRTEATGGERAQGTVLQPGRPGEPAETLPPGTTVGQPKWNQADVSFVQMMIAHHAQALEMSDLARTRAANERVAALARRIAGAQGPEIVGMSAWLQERGLKVPSVQHPVAGDGNGGQHQHHHGSTGGDHGMGGMQMPGMLSAREMEQLAAAEGARFDLLFLSGMIRHHRGAITMADRVSQQGGDIRVGEIAAEVAVGQSAEIDRMQDLQRRLTG